jgi:hypothetical protein
MSEDKKPDEKLDLRPRGTMVILILFVLTLIILWASVYMILLSRGVTV